MWTIRHEQTEAFEKHHLEVFESEMVEHLTDFSPPLAKVIGVPRLHETVRLGISRAEAYGFTNRGPLRLYLEMMLVYGSYFDTDPLLPWAVTVLHDPQPVHQMTRAFALQDKESVYSAEVSGPKRAHAIQALRKLQASGEEILLDPRRDSAITLLEGLKQMYPQRSRYLGEDLLKGFVRFSRDSARDYGFESHRSVALFTALGFSIGHAFSKDPLYPWVATALTDARIKDAKSREDRLYSKAMTYLKHVVAYLEAA